MLHFSGSRPDWQTIPQHDLNAWQRLAMHSRGVATPGNVVSVIGLGLVVAGLLAVYHGQYWWGLGLIAVGRACDIADGFVAHATGTKSPLGEAVDVLCDKVGAFLALAVLAVSGIVWWPLALLIALHNAANTVIGLIGKQRRMGIHPSAAGKYAAAGQWVALIGLLLAAAWHGPVAIVWRTAMYIVATSSLLLGIYATAGYKQLLRRRG